MYEPQLGWSSSSLSSRLNLGLLWKIPLPARLGSILRVISTRTSPKIFGFEQANFFSRKINPNSNSKKGADPCLTKTIFFGNADNSLSLSLTLSLSHECCAWCNQTVPLFWRFVEQQHSHLNQLIRTIKSRANIIVLRVSSHFQFKCGYIRRKHQFKFGGLFVEAGVAQLNLKCCFYDAIKRGGKGREKPFFRRNIFIDK